MSLKAFHIVFITLSSLLAFAFGTWCFRASEPWTGMGTASFAFGVGMIVYGVWFMRKIRTQDDEQRRRRDLFRTVSALGAVWLLSGYDAEACGVCYGDAEGPMIEAARSGVWVLFSFVLAMQIAFGSFFIVLWRRARKNRQENSAPGYARKGAA